MQWIADFFTKILDGIAAVFNWILEQILLALVALLALIPVPDWLSNASPAIQALFDTFGWGLGIIQAEFGFSVVISALIIRFIIRRLPFIG